uniref:Cytochrome c oxidase subunit 3 n=1 Tax=Hydatigera krepkogorski TaxID=1434709 RepID=N0DP47_9CEST|nr:cytochrome c oxidase subunit III [Hydatigera krepkogorski]BAN15678.1 cytochrome c oxidase subunit 3 [Hydatigera krepkogorski]
MSILPLFSASFIGLFLVGLFLWKVSLILLFFVCVVMMLVIYILDGLTSKLHYESAFWLFVFSEVMVFGSFLTCCLFFDCWSYNNLSSSLEIPFVGCFVLLGSSITITAFHHLLGWQYCDFFLLLTIVLGIGFVVLQITEMEDICFNLVDSSFYSSSFCTVGLHFSHVLLGVIGLVTIFCVGSVSFGVYRCTVLTWYWHFVDYIWLIVYTIVYVC